MSQGPLAGVRVLDFSWALVGSITTKTLGDLGCEVIKVESRSRPCLSRIDVQVSASRAGSFDDKPWFAHLNTSKLQPVAGHEAAGEPRSPRSADRLGRRRRREFLARHDGEARPRLPAARRRAIPAWSWSRAACSARPDRWRRAGASMAPARRLSGRTLLTGWPDRESRDSERGALRRCDRAVRDGRECHRRARQRAAEPDAAVTSTPRCTRCACSRCAAAYVRGGADAARSGNDDPGVFHQGVYATQGSDRWIAITFDSAAAWTSFRKRRMECRHTSATAPRGCSAPVVRIENAISRRVDDLQELGIAAGVVQDIAGPVRARPADRRRGIRWCHSCTRPRHLRAHAHAHRLSRVRDHSLFARPRSANTTGRSLRRFAVCRLHASTSCEATRSLQVITPAPSSGQRSRKDLACTAAATAHQREFVADLKRRVIDNGEPFAIAQADTPHEIFHAMDIPLITNQWWSAYISAKQLSPRYFERAGQARLSGQQLPLLLARVSRARSTTIRRPRPGAACRNRRCWSRGSPATASSTSSASGPRRSAATSFRSRRPAGRTRIRTGSRSRTTSGKSSTNRAASTCWSRRCATLIELLERKHRPPLRRCRSSSR